MEVQPIVASRGHIGLELVGTFRATRVILAQVVALPRPQVVIDRHGKSAHFPKIEFPHGPAQTHGRSMNGKGIGEHAVALWDLRDVNNDFGLSVAVRVIKIGVEPPTKRFQQSGVEHAGGQTAGSSSSVDDGGLVVVVFHFIGSKQETRHGNAGISHFTAHLAVANNVLQSIQNRFGTLGRHLYCVIDEGLCNGVFGRAIDMPSQDWIEHHKFVRVNVHDPVLALLSHVIQASRKERDLSESVIGNDEIIALHLLGIFVSHVPRRFLGVTDQLVGVNVVAALEEGRGHEIAVAPFDNLQIRQIAPPIENGCRRCATAGINGNDEVFEVECVHVVREPFVEQVIVIFDEKTGRKTTVLLM